VKSCFFWLAFGTFWLLFSVPAAQAQAAPPPPSLWAITGAKVYTLTGPPIENGMVLIRGTKIEAVGAKLSLPDGTRVVEANGLEVYPGLFDPITQMGLNEISAVSATVDVSELGDFNPELVAATAVNPASAHIPVTRSAGITHVVTAPGIGGFDSSGGGGIITGQASAMHMAGWTFDEMQIRRSVAMVLNWPSIETRSFDFATFSVKEKPFKDAKEEYDKQINALSDYIASARHYAQASENGNKAEFARDLRFEAMIPVVEGRLPLLVTADKARDIRNAVNFCDQQHLKMILAGGAEAWKEKDLLKQKNVPVILGSVAALPQEEDDAYDRPMTQPQELFAAGIPIAFASFDVSFSRRLGQYAGNAVAYGLPHDEALKAITVNAAKMLGLDGELGTIEAGKTANLIVTNGDPLEMRTDVKYIFINGQLASTDNKQKDLYREYFRRPAAAR
jgi:imidazolonepropionase-like amidohydrolase